MPGTIEPGTMPHSPGMSGSALVLRGDHHVAGAGADDLHQRARLDARPHRAHVGVEGAHGHGDARRQADLRGHLRRQVARLLVGRHGLRGVTVAQIGQGRIEAGQELLAGQPAPLVVVHGLVPGRADAAGQRVRDRGCR